MTKKAPPPNVNPNEKEKAVRWSTEVEDNQKKPPPQNNTTSTTTKEEDEAASEQLARALQAQNEASISNNNTPKEARIKLENDWELTWPIWHMLPLMERKEISKRHGYQTIGAFEEYMTLQKALDDENNLGSTTTSSSPYPNKLAYPKEEEDDDSKPAATVDTDTEQDEEEDDEESDSEADDKLTDPSSTTANDEDEETDSILLTFPDEILHKIFAFLPVTQFGTTLAYVCMHPHWRRTTSSEAVMRHLCERVYLQQSKKKQLKVSKFHHSYRFMLYQRPRVQAGGGLYVLRYGRVKPIQRDMWTEVPVGAVLETVYYRYLYFEEQGYCLYALSTIPPYDMLKRFHRVLLQSSMSHETPSFATATTRKPPRKLKGKEKEARAAELDTRVVWGTYTIQKDKVTVTAKQSWQTVQFGLRIVTHHNRPYEEHTYLHHNHNHNHNHNNPKEDTKPPALAKSAEDQYVNGKDCPTVSPHGRFGVLQLETHRSSVSGKFEEQDTYFGLANEAHPQVYHHSDVVNYTVEVDSVFRFLPDARF